VNTLSRHIIAELGGLDFDKINNPDLLLKIVDQMGKAGNFNILFSEAHVFFPQGLSINSILKESHLCLHSTPEEGYLSVDIFCCGQNADPLAAFQVLINELQPKSIDVRKFLRGVKITEDSFKISDYW